MKLKKYNQYIKEDLTPMSAEAENDMTGGIEGEIVGQDDEFMDYDGDDASTLIGNNMNDDDQEEEEGNDGNCAGGPAIMIIKEINGVTDANYPEHRDCVIDDVITEGKTHGVGDGKNDGNDDSGKCLRNKPWPWS